ncbi:MAG: FAD-dependent oxidoreductase [Daejeonella sp.]
MIREDFSGIVRALKKVEISGGLVITGGGIAGTCCAITAARSGIKVVLVQDRPVLGGNSSSEIRLWILGATSHMGNNNRWAREGGVIDEILVENTYRNPEGNPVIFDMVLLDKVASEPNITLLLNTVVYHAEKNNENTIESVKAFCSQNQTEYELTAPLFCDASGDGVLGFLSGAAFRMGAESKEEFGEKFAPSKEYGELLGHSLYFYTKDTGKPVKFVPPSFALDDITKIPRFRSFNTKEYGCRLWWIEYGGRLDTVYQTEEIKWELWKVVYGVWNYIKNSGDFPDAETLTLEWVGAIPGKRESRRFEGDYMLVQQDIVEQRRHPDAIAYGGWSMDLHPADAVFSEKPGCNQWHSKGIYQIPYRCIYSKNISNLFLAGRIISASHVAFSSTRVMGTSGCVGQAVGLAAVSCLKNNILPKEVLTDGRLPYLQQALAKQGHYIPGIVLNDENDLVQTAEIRASTTLELDTLPDDSLHILHESVAQMIPVNTGLLPDITVHLYADSPEKLDIELRKSSAANNYTPEVVLEKKNVSLHPGKNCVHLSFDHRFDEKGYAYLIFEKNDRVQLSFSKKRVTGILSVFNTINPAVSNNGKQKPQEDIGIDTFEFWVPKRRPGGENIALKFSPALSVFNVENLKNGISRPTDQPNAWVAGFDDENPVLSFTWGIPQNIKIIELSFDTDFDHPMESVLMTHPENIMPFCVQNYKIMDGSGKLLYEKTGNYQTRNIIRLEQSVITKDLKIQFEKSLPHVAVSLFEVRCYADQETKRQ